MGNLGWTSLWTLGLLVASVVFALLFVRIDSGNPNGFVDFQVFRNMTYTGATISNFRLRYYLVDGGYIAV